MTQPIRTLVFALTEFEKEAEDMTLRDCLEWYKKIINKLDTIRDLESKYLNERWSFLCSAVGEREGVPTGSLSYFLGELAQAEINLGEAAEEIKDEYKDV